MYNQHLWTACWDAAHSSAPPLPPHKKVMIMGEVINNIALFVQFQEHTTVQEQNQKI